MSVCIERRKQVYERYAARLSNIPGIRLCSSQKDVTPNYAYMPVTFDKEVFGKSRDDVFSMLAEKDIHARKYFYPAINDTNAYRSMGQLYKTPIARAASANILTLPMYEELSLEEVDRICDVILGL